MAPTFLIAGATGNTGKSVVETLPNLLKLKKSFSGYRILALTRSLKNPVAQQLAKVPGVEFIEKNWVEITADWLREQEVCRIFLASVVSPQQFADESHFLTAALHAGVKYVVRISTTAANIRPDIPVYYPRTHWAIEQQLSSPEFKKLQWSSLQPNAFTNFCLTPAAELIKQYRKTGKQHTLKLMQAPDVPVGIIDPDDVGVFAAHLLAEEDTSRHNRAKYVLNGPEDITGNQIVKMVENYIGAKVEKVIFKDMSAIDFMIEQSPENAKHLTESIKGAMVTTWEGKCSTSTTSKEVFKIAAPKGTPAQALRALL